MYLKIVRPKSNAGEVSETVTILEAKQFTHHVEVDTLDGSLFLVLVIDGEKTFYSDGKDVTVYVMNDNGKTIDKIEWNELVNHPEIFE